MRSRCEFLCIGGPLDGERETYKILLTELPSLRTEYVQYNCSTRYGGRKAERPPSAVLIHVSVLNAES